MHVESLNAAQELIDQLLEAGLDYSKHLTTIADQLFDNGLLLGNWDVCTQLEDEKLKDLRAIQEDEFDQHMTEHDNAPDYEDQVAYIATIPAYIWIL